MPGIRAAYAARELPECFVVMSGSKSSFETPSVILSDDPGVFQEYKLDIPGPRIVRGKEVKQDLGSFVLPRKDWTFALCSLGKRFIAQIRYGVDTLELADGVLTVSGFETHPGFGMEATESEVAPWVIILVKKDTVKGAEKVRFTTHKYRTFPPMNYVEGTIKKR